MGGRVCTWDSDEQTGLHFRSENAFAQGRPRRPRAPKARSFAPAPDQASLSILEHIRPALTFPLAVHVLNFLAHEFALIGGGDEPGQEYFRYIGQHCQLAPEGSSFQLALSAYAHAVFGRRKNVRSALCWAQRVYARCIPRVKEEMACLSSESFDQVLLSTLLMGSYEVRLSTPSCTRTGLTGSLAQSCMFAHREPMTQTRPDEIGSRFWENICHEKGASTLLTVRRQLGFAPNMELDRDVRRQSVSSFLSLTP